ncbi:T9SS type A sorting domain-containing protein [Owenweeksia hongkongensis]|uniref:T9SS type A sorting domain-containing protein n=1 Tax=Owenweeksia hongkongensis TaxID=253245 RepID=UPI003A9467DF
MLNKLAILLSLIALPFVNYACEVFSIDMRVQPQINATSLNHTFDVEIKVLLDDSCHFASQTHRFYVWTQCGEHYTEIAAITKSRAIPSSEFSCINTSQLSDTTLREFTLTGTFTLNDSKCPTIRTYFEYGEQTFYNIEHYDSVAVPVAGWVDLNGTLPDTIGHPTTNNAHFPDTTINMIGACLGEIKTISPMVSDHDAPWKDSLYMEVTKVCWVDTTSDTFPPLQKSDFLGLYNKAYPIPTNQYSVSKQKRINFTPTDTGLYALPVYAIEHTWDHIFALWIMKYRTYRLIPLFVSNQCTPSQTEAFAYDTIQYNCQQNKLYLPLQAMAHPGSISADGSDLKFHNSNGYPALISGARAKDFHASYTDTLELDIQFLYDGFYEVQLLQGTDGNRLLDDCGYQMEGNTRIMIQVSNCPVAGLDDFQSGASFSVYPNPAHHQISISGETEISAITIYNLTGQKVFKTNFKHSASEIQLTLKDKWNGLYYLEIQDSDGRVFTKKLVVD